MAKKLSYVMGVINCKGLIDTYVSYDEFVLVNNVLGEYDGIKKAIKNPNST